MEKLGLQGFSMVGVTLGERIGRDRHGSVAFCSRNPTKSSSGHVSTRRIWSLEQATSRVSRRLIYANCDDRLLVTRSSQSKVDDPADWTLSLARWKLDGVSKAFSFSLLRRE